MKSILNTFFIILLFISNSLYGQKDKLNQKELKELSYDQTSLSQLRELKSILTESYLLSKLWLTEKKQNSPEKEKLKVYNEKDIPYLQMTITKLSGNWDIEKKSILEDINKNIGEILLIQDSIMNTLNTFNSYSDMKIVFNIYPLVDCGGILDENISEAIDRIEILTKFFRDRINRNLPEINIKTIQSRDEKKQIVEDYFKSSGFMKKLNYKSGTTELRVIKDSCYQIIYDHFTEIELKQLIIIHSDTETSQLIEKERELKQKIDKYLVD